MLEKAWWSKSWVLVMLEGFERVENYGVWYMVTGKGHVKVSRACPSGVTRTTPYKTIPYIHT